MRLYELKRRQVLPGGVEKVFQFFESPENLAAITPASLGFKMLTPLPVRMKEGALLDYVVHPFLLPIRWTTLITDYDPPRRFADVQLRGPYAYWHHTHTFTPSPEGTVMEDVVRYALPFGPIGALAAPIVRRQLDAIFDFRAETITRLFR